MQYFKKVLRHKGQHFRRLPTTHLSMQVQQKTCPQLIATGLTKIPSCGLATLSCAARNQSAPQSQTKSLQRLRVHDEYETCTDNATSQRPACSCASTQCCIHIRAPSLSPADIAVARAWPHTSAPEKEARALLHKTCFPRANESPLARQIFTGMTRVAQESSTQNMHTPPQTHRTYCGVAKHGFILPMLTLPPLHKQTQPADARTTHGRALAMLTHT